MNLHLQIEARLYVEYWNNKFLRKDPTRKIKSLLSLNSSELTVPESLDQTCPLKEAPMLLFEDKIQTISSNLNHVTHQNFSEIIV